MEQPPTPSFPEVPISSPRLPIELLVSIAEILAGDICFGTIANLNVACRIVHEETVSVLYETLTVSYSQLKEVASGSLTGGTDTDGCTMGWAHVKFFIVEDFPIAADLAQDIPPRRSMFPMLRLYLVKEDRVMRWPYRERIRPCELRLYASIEFETLMNIIVSSTRVSRTNDLGGSIPERVNKVTVEEGGTVVCGTSSRSTRLDGLRSSAFSDRISVVVGCRGQRRSQENFAEDLLRMLKLLLLDWSNSEVSSMVHYSCDHTLLPDLMAVSGLLPSQVGLSVRVLGAGMRASAFRKLIDKGAMRYLSARNQLVCEGKQDRADDSGWVYISKIERRRRAVWAMTIQAKITGETAAHDPSTSELLDGDWCQFANVYIYDARMPTGKAEGGAEAILGFTEIVGGVGFANVVTEGHSLELYSQSC